MAQKPIKRPKKTAKYYRENPKAKAKKQAYDKKANAKPAAKAKRAELAKERRKRGIMGKGGPDVSHTKKGGTVLENKSKNRARKGAGGKAKKK